MDEIFQQKEKFINLYEVFIRCHSLNDIFESNKI